MTRPVLLFTQEFPGFSGGVATYCYELAHALVAAGQPVVVVAPRHDPDDPRRDRDMPFPVLRYRHSRFFPLRHLARLLALAAAVRRYRPALVWGADWRVGTIAVAACRPLGIPVAVTAYGTEIMIARSATWKDRIARATFRGTVAVFAISRYVEELLLEYGVDPGRVHRVMPGVHRGTHPPDDDAAENMAARIRRRLGLEARRVILTLGRLTPRKGQDVVIEALADVRARGIDAVYVIAGTGPDRSRLEQHARRHGVEDHVLFTGHVPDAEKSGILRACDVFVTLSRQDGPTVEGFGIAFLEAGLQRRPVVAGYHGGVPDAVEAGTTGFLVPPTSSPDAADAIVTILQDADLARRLGEAGRVRALSDFSWRTTASRSLEILQPWLSTSASGPPPQATDPTPASRSP